MIKRGQFLEWANIYAHRYGTSLPRVLEAIARGDEIVLKIDVQGGESVRDRMGDDAIFIFLLPPSNEELRRRLVARATEDPKDVELRWATAIGELAEQDKYDQRVVNDDARRAAQEISAILNADRTARHAGLSR